MIDELSHTSTQHTHNTHRYHVAWSPCLPAVASACSFDRKVQFYSMSGAKSRLGRAPKWLKKPTGATFGFGGKLISFDCGSLDGAAPSDAMKGKVEREVEIEVEAELDLWCCFVSSCDSMLH